MSTEQEDIALLFELEKKIEQRIREQIYFVIWGMEAPAGSVSSVSLNAPDLRISLRNMLVNDPGFVTELTKKIGAKMTNIY